MLLSFVVVMQIYGFVKKMSTTILRCTALFEEDKTRGVRHLDPAQYSGGRNWALGKASHGGQIP
jgi:hypothetical protein